MHLNAYVRGPRVSVRNRANTIGASGLRHATNARPPLPYASDLVPAVPCEGAAIGQGENMKGTAVTMPPNTTTMGNKSKPEKDIDAIIASFDQ
jgi:hypothetical protein